MELIDNRFRIIKKIYTPEIADTYLTEDTLNNNKLVDVKILIKTKYINNMLFNMFKSEVIVIKDLNHSGIVKYIHSSDVDDVERYFYVATEHVDGVSLKELMVSDSDLITSKFSEITIKLLEIMGYLESKNIIHKSISSENIIVDKNFNLYLTNFGAIQNKLKSGRAIDPIIGDFDLMPNEQKLGFTTLKSDQYVLGILLLNIISLNMMNGEIIKKKNIKEVLLPSISISEKLRKFLEIMINNDSTERFISINYALEVFKKIEANEEISISSGHKNVQNNIEDEYIAEQIVKNEYFYTEIEHNQKLDKYKKRNYKMLFYFIFFMFWGYFIYNFIGSFMKSVKPSNPYQKSQYKKVDVLLDVYKRDNGK
jgi:serine/threonine-protein kinase